MNRLEFQQQGLAAGNLFGTLLRGKQSLPLDPVAKHTLTGPQAGAEG